MAKVCGLCGFRADDDAVFDEHMRQLHQWDRVTASEPTDRWRTVAAIVSMLAIVLLLASSCGMAEIGYRYSPGALDRVRLAMLLALGAVVGLNVTAFLGTSRRWPYVTPVAVVWLLLIGASLYVASCTPVS